MASSASETVRLPSTALTSVTIPAFRVISIGFIPFVGCFSLMTITVDVSNPAYASASGVLFNKTGTTPLIEFPEGPAGAYVIPSGVTSIGDSAFYVCLA